MGHIVLDAPGEAQCDHAGYGLELPASAAKSTPIDEIRVATIAGAGERAFSAGSDLNVWPT